LIPQPFAGVDELVWSAESDRGRDLRPGPDPESL